MSTPTTDDVIRILRTSGPMTSRQVADRLGTDRRDRISSQLSRLAAYGKIDREAVRRPNSTSTPPRRWYVWKAKEPTHIGEDGR